MYVSLPVLRFTRLNIAIMLTSLALTSLAQAQSSVTFVMKNNHPNAVELELYSNDRNHVWPGNNEVYLLDDGETKTIPLSCQEGETICYGAWLSGDKQSYWGVGPDNTQNCDNCCYVCGDGNTEEINLDE